MLTPQQDADSRENADSQPASGWDIRDAESLGMPADIVDLVDAFPMGLTDCPINKSHFTDRNFLPSRSRGFELVELYYRNVSWMFVISILSNSGCHCTHAITLGMIQSFAQIS